MVALRYIGIRLICQVLPRACGGRNLKLTIYIPDADNSTRTVSCEYTVSDAFRFFGDHDEFYGNVTGDEWPISIAESSAHVTLPR